MFIRQFLLTSFIFASYISSIFICLSVDAAENKRADAIITLFKTSKPSSPQQASSLLQELKKTISPDDLLRQKEYIRAKCWNQKVETNVQIKQAISFANEQLDIFNSPAPSKITIDLTLCKTTYQRLLGQVDTTLQDLTNAINQAYIIEAPLLIAHGYSQRGTLHSYQGNYSASLEDLLTAQSHYESLKLSYWANINLGELATSYRRFGDAKSALKYQLQLEDIYIKEGKIFEANDINIQIASSLEQLNDLEEANTRYRMSQEFLHDKQPVISADMSINIANNLISLGQYSKALTLLQQAESIITPEYNAPYSFLQLYLANTQFKLNNYPASLAALQNAEKAFIIDKNQRGLSKVLELRSNIYQAAKDWQNAYQSLADYLKVHLAQDERVLTKLNAELRTRFDTDRIKHENDLLLQHANDKEIQLHMLQRNKTMQIIIISLVGIILILVSIFAYKQMYHKQQYRKLAFTDELTQVANRRETYVQAERCLTLCKKSKKPFSLIFFDADYFKLVNDELGHYIGDQVLICLADIATKVIRNGDILGRVGGEEFIILLPDTEIEVALTIANRLLTTIEQYEWSTVSSNLTQTVSAGVVRYQEEKDLSELLLKADKALYEAKAAGRNHVKVYL